MAFIVFLGTGDADGIPALSCLCKHCNMARQNKTKQRSWASLFISDGETNIIVDPSPELRSQLIRTGLDKEPVHGIVITHWHFEHWIGLVELEHSPPSIGFIFKLDKRCVAYLVDSDPGFPRKTLDALKECTDMLVLDNTWEKTEGPGHMDITQAVNLVNKVVPTTASATHIGHKNLPHEELDKTLGIKTDGIFKAAYDGLKVEV